MQTGSIAQNLASISGEFQGIFRCRIETGIWKEQTSVLLLEMKSFTGLHLPRGIYRWMGLPALGINSRLRVFLLTHLPSRYDQWYSGLSFPSRLRGSRGFSPLSMTTICTCEKIQQARIYYKHISFWDVKLCGLCPSLLQEARSRARCRDLRRPQLQWPDPACFDFI